VGLIEVIRRMIVSAPLFSREWYGSLGPCSIIRFGSQRLAAGEVGYWIGIEHMWGYNDLDELFISEPS
jgi:hypothetical protein